MTKAAGAAATARRTLAVQRAQLAAELQATAAYRAQLLVGALGWVVPVAFLALWRGAADGVPVDGVTAGQFTTYFCVLLVTTSVQLSLKLAFDLGPLVHDGRLSALLLRPAHPLHVLVAEGLAERLVRAAPLVVLAPALAVALGGTGTSSASQWLLAAVVGLLGLVCVALLGAMTGCVALWVTQSMGLRGLLFGAEWVLGGLVAPVALFPGPLPEVLRHQPLWFAIGAPGEAVAGISELSAWTALEALVWLVVLQRLLQVVWRRGLRRFEAVGT